MRRVGRVNWQSVLRDRLFTRNKFEALATLYAGFRHGALKGVGCVTEIANDVSWLSGARLRTRTLDLPWENGCWRHQTRSRNEPNKGCEALTMLLI